MSRDFIHHILLITVQISAVALSMAWQLFWALILGFFISALILTFVSREKLSTLLGKAGFKELALATVFGAASSSCSYAAASMSRSLFQKGAHITTALAFMLASTNLVIELSLVLLVLMGWHFVAAEIIGGVILVCIMSLLMKFFAPLKAFEQKRRDLNATQGAEALEQESACCAGPQTIIETSKFKIIESWRAVAGFFFNEVKMIWKDIFIGVVVSAMIMVLVPTTFWQSLFLQNSSSSFFKMIENALVGPLVSMVSFVCSVGNIPLANALYQGGIGFGGAIAFIFADLIVIPLILIYKNYYGWRLALFITSIFYVSMVLTGIIVETLFSLWHWVPAPEHMVMSPAPATIFFSYFAFFKIDYVFWLNLFFFALTLVLGRLTRGPFFSRHNKPCH